MEISKKIKQFRSRWNINYSERNDFESFQNHILFSTDKILGNFLLSRRGVSDKFAYLMGSPIQPRSVIGSRAVLQLWEEEQQNSIFIQNIVYITLKNSSSLIQLITALQYLVWVLEEESEARNIVDAFIEDVQKAIYLSPSLNVRLIKRDSGILFYPAGAKLLDDKLVNDNLLWLEDYPKVLKHFEEALLIYGMRDVDKYRNLLDNLRLALEQLLRTILGNKKTLENQKMELLYWIKEKNINQQIVNMFNELLFQNYRIYQNENVKHGDYWSPEEIEFMIYLTGNFIRLLIQLHKNTEK